jgi:hypothetical protein
MTTDQEIKDYARLLWEKAGRPEGKDQFFRHQAEAELKAESEISDAFLETTETDNSILPG